MYFFIYSVSWFYVEDVEEFIEKKDDLLNNRLILVMILDVFVVVVVLVVCFDV